MNILASCHQPGNRGGKGPEDWKFVALSSHCGDTGPFLGLASSAEMR